MAAIADPPEAPAKRITPLEPRPPSMAPGLGTIGGAPTDADSPAKPPDAEVKPAPPQTLTPVEPRPQSMAPGLGTAGGAPIDQKPSATEDPRVQAIPEAKKPVESTTKPEDPRVQAVPEKPQPAEDPRVQAIQPPPAQPQPQPQPQQPEKPAEQQAQPPADDRDAQIQALIQKGKTPGEAQAIVDGQQPKTLNGQTPPKAELVDPDPDKRYLDYLARSQGYRPGMAPWEQETAPTTPEQQAHKPIDSLKADDKNRVDPVSLYSYLLGKFAHSGVVGHVPPDGERWGIKTGSAAEWAAFALAVAKQESDLNTRSTNLADPGGSYGLFQFSQKTQPQFTNGEDQYDPQHSADAFVRAVEQLVGPKGKIDNLGVTFGSIRRPNEAGQYLAGAQKVAAGGSGKDLVSSGGGGGGGGKGKGGGGGGGSGDDGLLFNVPFQQGYNPPPQQALSFDSGGGGGTPGYREAPTQSDAGNLNLGALAGAALAGTAAGRLFRSGEEGGGRPQAPQPSEEKGPSPSDVVSKVLAAGGPPPAPGAETPDLSTMKQANVLGVRTLGAPQLGLPAPPAAPSAAPTGPDPIVIKGLMKRGFTRAQAEAFAAKATVSKPGAAAVTGAASFRKPLQLPAPPPAPSGQPPAAAKPQPQAPAVKPPPQEQPPAKFEAASHNMRPLGYHAAVKLPNGEVFSGPEHADALDNAAANASMRVSDATTNYGFVHKKNKNFIGMDEADRLLEKHWYQERGLPEPPPIAAEPTEHVGARAGSTIGVAKPAGSEALEGLPLAQAVKEHAALLSPDDPRVKKQADGMFKGEHFVPGDPVHDPALAGLPGGHGGRQRQILGEAEQAIAEKRPLHIGYISAPQEAEKFPTRESRKIQYDEHSPEGRLMGTTEGQLVGHSMIPVSVGIKLPKKAGEPHQSYIQGISTNVLANNFQHVNTKLAAMGQKTPYAKLGQKFANDLEGYLSNLIAGHTGTGRGYAVGTAEYPNEPDTSHVPYKLTRHEADFINVVLNNSAAFAKHGDADKLRELARVNGTLVSEAGETNRMRHEMEQHEPGWRQRMLEPSIRSFKTGLIHEVHPTEEHLPATIRPGQEYRDLTAAMQRTSERGRPDVGIAVSLHHTFADNKAINQIERDFSEERISEADARARLHALGEDPDQYRFVGGSGGLITPYEDDGEQISQSEHNELKNNLRKQWIGGKMPIEDYRRKIAEVPLPTKPSRPEEGHSEPEEAPSSPVSAMPRPAEPSPTAPSAAKPRQALAGQDLPKTASSVESLAETHEETPETPAPVKQRGFKAYKELTAAAPSAPARPPEVAAPEEPAEKKPVAAAPTEGPAAPPAPGESLPPAKAKRPAKTKEDKAAEAEDLRQAASDRNDISEKDTKQLNRLQRVAKGWVKQNPELHPLSAHTYLTGQKEFPNQGELTKAGIGEHFDAENPTLDFEKEEHRQHAAGGIVHDIMHALAGTKTGKPSSAYGWYDRAVRKTLAKIGQIAPKILSDPEHGLAFKLGTAITSQGQDVFPNAVSGWQVYRHWLKHGELPTDAKVFGGGPKAEQMVQNFAKVNNLWKELGSGGLQKLLTTKKTVRDLRDKYGLEIDEPLDTKVSGAMALGPKIGAFFSNLHGNFDPTTIDMWFSRTMNRLGGNMFGFSDKAMRQDRMEKGKVVKSHLSELGDLLNSGQLTGVDKGRAQKMQAELAALKAHPQGQLDQAKALELAPEIHNWAKERTKVYAKSEGYERSFHPDLKTPENVLGKKLHEGVNELSDAPRTASERRHWHDIMTRVDTQLRNAGVKLTNADKQALLWFVEKDLFRQGGSNSKVNADYLDAAYRLVRKVKSGELPGLEQPSGGVLKMAGGV